MVFSSFDFGLNVNRGAEGVTVVVVALDVDMPNENAGGVGFADEVEGVAQEVDKPKENVGGFDTEDATEVEDIDVCPNVKLKPLLDCVVTVGFVDGFSVVKFVAV